MACKSGFFLPVRVLSRLFRRLLLEQLSVAHHAGDLQFFGAHQYLTDPQDFASYLAPLRRSEWVVYAKRPLKGPAAVLAYLSRYTHRVAIANSRLIACDERGVTFKWKDYRAKTMTLATGEFIRRFLIHILPAGFHRIRHYGLLANKVRANHLARAQQLLQKLPSRSADDSTDGQHTTTSVYHCTSCGAPMFIIESFTADHPPRAPPAGQP